MNEINIDIPYGELEPGDRFSHGGNVWQKRDDNLGADLVDRDGSISFIGGRRCIKPFEDQTKVMADLDRACDIQIARQKKAEGDLQRMLDSEELRDLEPSYR